MFFHFVLSFPSLVSVGPKICSKIQPMDSLRFDNLLLNGSSATLELLGRSILLTTFDTTHTIEQESLRNILCFPSRKQFCLRIISNDAIYDLLNLPESAIKQLRSVFSHQLSIPVTLTELERLDTINGNLVYSNSILSFQNRREIFSIPKSSIKRLIELHDDLELRLADMEIVFNTRSTISQFMGTKLSDEVCIISNISCINPRSKSTLVFFSDYFVLKGVSYDHSIFYSNICEILLLKHDSLPYLVLKLDTFILQGHTKYDSLVFVLNNTELELAAKDSRLKSYYNGELSNILPEILESLTQIEIQECSTAFKCTTKVYEGYLYLLNESLQFLPRAISIPINEISYVEFTRINLSIAQAKTFDMTVVATKVYPFTGIQKSAFPEIEVYFNKNSIKIISEVIDESISSETENDEDESDLSGMIASDEE